MQTLHATFAVLAFAIIIAPAVRSQVPTPHDSAHAFVQRAGVMADHEFIPCSYVRDPFLHTYLGIALGFGETPNRTAPDVTVAGKPVTGMNGNLLFGVGNVEFRFRVRDWLAFWAQVNGIGRLANQAAALIAEGVTMGSGYEFGWLFRLKESQRFLLSGSVEIKNAMTTDVYIQQFMESAADSGGAISGSRLLTSTPSLRGGVGIHGAYVLSKLTGVTFSGKLEFGEPFDREGPDKWYYNMTVAFDFNLRSTTGTPIGFAIGAGSGSGPVARGMDDRSSQSLFGRIAYTGSNDFALGVDVSYDFVPIRHLNERQKFVSAIADVRLFF